ncbi:cleft lip and palate transmembrane protein 1-like protein [Megalops cyprinoides]|uniref:cleft lip and palate transmembrane protein 1-like protein n=1 Tax=Megalops cyprinoides TaxID=118141 RepID=UPI001864BA00|nr:cleft lip and palate transmembrane protein 1-like protein [Megalops cyprinoides]
MFPACYSKAPNGKFQKTSFTTLIAGVFIVYVLHTCWMIYGIVYTKPCVNFKGDNCIASYLAEKPRLQLSIYTSLKPKADGEHRLIFTVEDFDIYSSFERTINVSLPTKTRDNGTLYVRVFVHHAGMSPWQDSRQVNHVAQLTTYMLPKPSEVSFISSQETAWQGEEREHSAEAATDPQPIPHWRSRLTFNIMAEDFAFSRGAVPSDVQRYLRVFQSEKKMLYLPVLFIDELSNRVRDLMEINSTTTELPLTLSHNTISLVKFRIWIHMQDIVYSLQRFGFTEKDVDEFKGIFVDAGQYFLSLTFFVAMCHLLYDFLAFKNDISFWKKQKSTAGISTKAVLWRCFGTVVILFYLRNEQVSLLVLIPAGIGTLIEVWKVKKAFRIQILWSDIKPVFQFGKSSESEKRTEEYDTQAVKYLSYFLCPLSLGGAIYSIIYVKYNGWFSWLINSLAYGVHGFGFLFMLPQLFVNYKLKSVAHIPWRTFMYKAFNTVIDDIFTVIIGMPTSHWLACFRDDVVFLICLYQRWLYPVGATRVDECGVLYNVKPKGKLHKD